MWQSGFWAEGFWADGFWGDETVISRSIRRMFVVYAETRYYTVAREQ